MNIYKFIISTFFITYVQYANAQSDTLVSENSSLSNIRKTGTDSIFFKYTPIKQLWKISYFSAIPKDFSSAYLEIKIGYERKLTNKLSFNSMIGLHGDDNSDYPILSLIIEPRYYVKKNSDNLTGLYLGVASQINFYKKPKWYKFNEKENRFGITLGVQNRFLNLGIFDLGIFMGIKSDVIDMPIWTKDNNTLIFSNNYKRIQNYGFFINTFARIGIGYLDLKKKNNLLRKYFSENLESQNQMFKINMTRFLVNTNNNTVLGLNLSYETKIRESAWSINQNLNSNFVNTIYHEFRLDMNKIPDYNETYSVKNYGLLYGFEPRYYFNLKRRIKKGLAANNLSGHYITSINTILVSKYAINVDEGNIRLTMNNSIAYGLQYKISKHLFFDINIGPKYFTYSLSNKEVYSNFSYKKLSFNFHVGYTI